jgi:hypothetical protein
VAERLFHTLLADADTLGPVLPEGLVPESTLEVPKSKRDPNRADVPRLGRRDANPNDLSAQRWGVVVREGRAGDELLEALAPLMELRKREQGAPVDVLKPPSSLEEAGAAAAWRDTKYRTRPTRERPEFLLLLGDVDQLSLELQHALAHSAFVGRLAFSTPEGRPDLEAYHAYVRKVLRASAQAPVTRSADVLFYTATDGTAATTLGEHLLVTPCQRTLSSDWTTQRFGLNAESGGEPPVFLDAVRDAPGTVLLSVSHGLGRGRRNWSSPEEQRARQGALLLAPGLTLDAEQVRHGPFLPGGIWLSVACFGAATPPRSAFYPWLKQLSEHDAYRANAKSVLESLPQPERNERAFLAALPQAALANPEGPLAVIGHSDLAWTYGFTDPEELSAQRSSRFSDVLDSLARGSRAGVAFDLLMSYFRDVNDSLRADIQARQDASAYEQDDPVDPRSHGHRWMLGNDLRGYLLLGDPAVHLRAAAAPKPPAQGRLP